MSNAIVIRVQSDEGTKRINAKPTERTKDFLEKVQSTFDLEGGGWGIYVDRGRSKQLDSSKTKTLSTYRIKHGDMLFLVMNGASVTDRGEAPSQPFSAQSMPVPQSSAAASNQVVVEDEVDQQLDKVDGQIMRDRNEQLCRHNPQGKCLHCVPLEPYDEEHLKSQDIKFLSFHSYLRKLRGGADKGKFAVLENLSCKIKAGCSEHPPWPGGICTKCQPNAVTLNRQKYRHVDYVQFENPFLMERFLNYWRSTGNQRLGFLYGKYEQHKDVPLGIKAVVSAIYEPPQVSTKNGIELLEDGREQLVNRMAGELGLACVGWIFTDLVAQDLTTGTVKHFRGNINSHFLSAEECIMAANFQNKHPNPCKLSPDGYFGSKFATVAVTGDVTNQIHFEAYQVSDQCTALVRDDCLIPTRDAPELGYVKESSNEQYVPDVFYKEKDTYGNEVTQLARPLPVEYLMVDLAAAFPVEPKYTFSYGDGVRPMPVEHRDDIGEIQDFNALSTYLSQFTPDKYLQAFSDFHVLLYVSTCDMLPLKDIIGELLKAVKNKDEDVAHHWFKKEEWATVEQLMAAHMPSPPTSRQASYTGPHSAPLPSIPGGATGGGGASAMWTCKHCTLHNSLTSTSCEACGLPQN
eukprot:GHVU01023869.1.p1 GENE.GHVU01023869.1~~GHVU01023869.1.p1  ORF type:complete len:631 (-),score=55.89 GHVU01023869.1:1001-2893(-)